MHMESINSILSLALSWFHKDRIYVHARMINVTFIVCHLIYVKFKVPLPSTFPADRQAGTFKQIISLGEKQLRLPLVHGITCLEGDLTKTNALACKIQLISNLFSPN